MPLGGLTDQSLADQPVDLTVLGRGIHPDRRENPDDRRGVMIATTDDSAALVDAVTAHRREAIARIVRDLPASDRPALIAALEAFAASANEPTAGTDQAYRLGW